MLESHGIQATQQRVQIAVVFLGEAQHRSAEEIRTLVNDVAPSVSKATVYNTLRLFAKKGLLREVLVDPSKLFFDSNTEPHHHIYNVDTGELTDIEHADIRLTNLPSLPSETEILDVDVVVRVRSIP